MALEPFRQQLLALTERAGLRLTNQVLEQLDVYFQLLTRWNRKMNLTALPLEPPTTATLERLIVEPLLASRHVRSVDRVWFDIGSGAGSPAIPIKIVQPRATLTMIEAKARKAAFLREAIRTLRLEGAQVVNDRFESFVGEESAGLADLVTLRAVRVDDELLLAAAMAVRSGGRILHLTSDASREGPKEFISIAEVPISTSASGSTLLRIFERR